MTIDALCSDAEVASLLRMSRSWVRKQRMLRRAGKPHILTIDPIMIGSCPRYRFAEIEAWLEVQAQSRNGQKRHQRVFSGDGRLTDQNRRLP
jgi:predicted DNA-binding transcriptional regulator AlpA